MFIRMNTPTAPLDRAAERRAEAFRRLARVLLEQARQEIAERDAAAALAAQQRPELEIGRSSEQP